MKFKLKMRLINDNKNTPKQTMILFLSEYIFKNIFWLELVCVNFF